MSTMLTDVNSPPTVALIVSEPKHEEASPAPRESWFMRWINAVGGPNVAGAAFGGSLVTALWIALFTVGLSVPSQPFRDGLLAVGASTPPPNAYPVTGPASALYALVVTCFSYTPTNLAILCCTASLVGCLGFSAMNRNGNSKHENADTHEKGEGTDAHAAGKKPTAHAKHNLAKGSLSLRPAVSAVTWGFFIYLFLISGTLIAVENPFATTSPEQYLRLAGTASLLAFVVGWQPEVLMRLVAQVGTSRIGGKDDHKS